MGFIKNIISRFDFSMTYFTVFELLLVLLIYPLIKYADPNLFVENGPVENLQLFILLIGMVVCLSGRQNKPLFVFCAFIIIFLMIRETNLGRSYFCAKYLTPTDVCKLLTGCAFCMRALLRFIAFIPKFGKLLGFI